MVNVDPIVKTWQEPREVCQQVNVERKKPVKDTGQPWSIGINSWQGVAGYLFAGDIAEIRINNRVLDSGEWLLNQ